MARLVKIIAAAILAMPVVYVGATYRNLVGVFTHNDQKERAKTEYIVIHHDAINRESDLWEIQANHLKEWGDYFPYTFYLKDGIINQTRGIDIHTSHAIGRNSNGIGVCIHTPDKQNLRDQFNLILTIWFLQLYYDIPRDRVIGHGEIENTETDCPDMDMNEIRKKCIK